MKRKIKVQIDIQVRSQCRNITAGTLNTLNGFIKTKKDKRDNPSDTITEELQNSFATFLNLVPAKRLGQHIRTLLLYYLRYEIADGIDGDFEQNMKFLGDFFDFLDTIQDEYDQSTILEPTDPVTD